MRTWRRILALSAVTAAGLVAGVGDLRAQTTGGDVIVIGVNLSGQWDFDMTVLGASDPAMIGRTFTGSFTVSGGVPTYTGDGTFNGLRATISGNGAVDPADGVTITLSDHIATTDSKTTFSATLMSGDFGTGTFAGGTIDGTQTWEGVFKLAITRPPTQTPEEQIESAFQTTLQRVADIQSVSVTGLLAAAKDAVDRLQTTLSREGVRAIAKEGHAEIEAIRTGAFAQYDDAFRSFRSEVEKIIEHAPPSAQTTLRRLAGSKTAALARARSGGTRLIAQEAGHDNALLQEAAAEEDGEMTKEVSELRELARVIGKAAKLARGFGNALAAQFLEEFSSFLEALAERIQEGLPIDPEDCKKLKHLLNGDPATGVNPANLGVLQLLSKRIAGPGAPKGTTISVEEGVGLAEVVVDEFLLDVDLPPEFSGEELKALKALIGRALAAALNILPPAIAEKKFIALDRLLRRLCP